MTLTGKNMAQPDPQFFRPFIDGTKHILKISCQTDALAGKPFLKQPGARTEYDIDIAAVVGITGEGWNGTVTLCFPGKVYLGLIGKMLGENFSEINPDNQDGAGEMMNMIFGHAKVILNQQGHALQKALPTVIRGSKLVTNQSAKSQVIVIPFSVVFGEFYVEIYSAN